MMQSSVLFDIARLYDTASWNSLGGVASHQTVGVAMRTTNSRGPDVGYPKTSATLLVRVRHLLRRTHHGHGTWHYVEPAVNTYIQSRVGRR